MQLFKCSNCGQVLYFENRNCQQCGYILGFLPETGNLEALQPAEADWQRVGVSDQRYRFCANAELDACNWIISCATPDRFCLACRHNRTIPDLSVPENLERWQKFEIAKHRLFYTILRFNLPHPTREEDPVNGLAFDFLADPETQGTEKIMTGHDEGLITINLKEADDAEREKLRTMMGEPYRTLLGHFRHEIGHYYWDRLVRDAGQFDGCRAVFGDDREDYTESLQKYYETGAPPTWQDNYVSAYATSHPWEDFAETWAHFLHIIDALETGRAFGIKVDPIVTDAPGLTTELNIDPMRPATIDQIIDEWLPLSFALNSMSRGMGGNDLYPFILAQPAIQKLSYINELLNPSGNAS